MAYDVENTGDGLLREQICGGVQPVIGIHTLLSW
jgi:hypothetical protein